MALFSLYQTNSVQYAQASDAHLSSTTQALLNHASDHNVSAQALLSAINFFIVSSPDHCPKVKDVLKKAIAFQKKLSPKERPQQITCEACDETGMLYWTKDNTQSVATRCGCPNGQALPEETLDDYGAVVRRFGAQPSGWILVNSPEHYRQCGFDLEELQLEAKKLLSNGPIKTDKIWELVSSAAQRLKAKDRITF